MTSPDIETRLRRVFQEGTDPSALASLAESPFIRTHIGLFEEIALASPNRLTLTETGDFSLISTLPPDLDKTPNQS